MRRVRASSGARATRVAPAVVASMTMTWTIELDRIASNYGYMSIGYAELEEIRDLVDSFRAYARPHKLGHVALELRAARAAYTSPERRRAPLSRRCATPAVRSRAAL